MKKLAVVCAHTENPIQVEPDAFGRNYCGRAKAEDFGDEEERARVLAMLECGRTQEQVARRFNVSRSTIRRLVRRVRVTGTFADRPRSGRPRVTSVRQDNFIRQRHLCDRFVTAESTSRLVVGNRGRSISRYTVRR